MLIVIGKLSLLDYVFDCTKMELDTFQSVSKTHACNPAFLLSPIAGSPLLIVIVFECKCVLALFLRLLFELPRSSL